jgi:hypothetical protein
LTQNIGRSNPIRPSVSHTNCIHSNASGRTVLHSAVQMATERLCVLNPSVGSDAVESTRLDIALHTSSCFT